MRLVEVRDFLAGQNWFDLTQYRLDPPDGVVMHWSRLIDLPLALLIQRRRALLPSALSERIVLTLWPTALLLVFFAGILRLARELAGETAARVALIFAALMAPVLQHFRSGAIHHHGVQIVLMIWALVLFVRMPARPRDGAIAGLIGALSVAIGQEMVPAVATLAVMSPCAGWSKASARARDHRLCLALAAGAVALGAATSRPRITSPSIAMRFDRASRRARSGGFGLAALAALPGLHSIARRLAAAGGLAVVLAVAVGSAPRNVSPTLTRNSIRA